MCCLACFFSDHGGLLSEGRQDGLDRFGKKNSLEVAVKFPKDSPRERTRI